MKKVGFIGLGIMGKGMALNLVKHEFPLTVYDISPAPVSELVAAGAKEAKSPREVAEQSEVIVTCLPMPKDVEEVACGPNGILEGAKEGSTIIDTSTIDPDTIQRVAALAAEKGVDVIDSTMAGGGPKGAAVGQQTLITGAKKEVIDRCSDVLNVLGNNIVHVGDVGMGKVIKLCFNMYAATEVAAAAEAFAFGVKCGADPKTIFDVINTAKGGDWILERVCPWPDLVPGTPASRNYEMPGFFTDLLKKDLGLVADTAKAKNVPLYLSNIVLQILEATSNIGLGKKDYTSMMILIRRLAGLESDKI